MKISMLADFAMGLFRAARPRRKNDSAFCNIKAILLPDFAHTETADGSAGVREETH
jgi:hypothetical protein